MSEQQAGSDAKGERPRFEIYRVAEAREYSEVLAFKDLTPVMIDGLTRFGGNAEPGATVKLLYARPGFSLTHVWFKSGYPLPLHSHGSDCLYQIIAGSIRIGDETLGPGDGFFVGSDVPYTYAIGPEGVEVLEFRDTEQQDISYQSRTKKAWDRMVAKLGEQQDEWAGQLPPSQIGAAE